jgi:phosphate transport system substrate-binding protein
MKLQAFKSLLGCAVVLTAASVALGEAPSPIDPSLPVYPRVEGLKGKLSLVGSNTMSQLAAIWGTTFRQMYPEVEIDVQVKGAANAVASVVNGEANFGLLSRTITEEEVKSFHDKYGYLPTVLTPSLEPIAVYVNKTNPIESLTLAQLDAIYSTTLKRGAPRPAQTWGDLGVAGEWASKPIACQTRNDNTGSQVFFQAAVMGGGDFRPDVTRNAKNSDLIKSIGSNPGAIGFAGSLYETPDVKVLPVSWREGEAAIGPHEMNYPLVRPLQIVVNKPPQTPLTELEQEFIKFVFSKRGQQDVIIGGFVPIPSRPAQIALDAVGLSTLN